MTLKKTFIRVSLIGYILLSLPIVVLFCKSEYLRYVAVQMVANWRGKLSGLPAVYLGDSITVGGRNWGTPFGSINKGGNFYSVWQVETLIPEIEIYQPKRIFILAGTNDIIGNRPFEAGVFEDEYRHLLDRSLKVSSDTVVTLIPFTADKKHSENIMTANAIILNPIVAPNKTLLPEYTTDGIHLTEAAYRIWIRKIGEIR
jgi:lysophospholipase L1-like esterase